MRIMGFGKKWDKLKQPEFTTFRFQRRDKDWVVGERAQIVYKPRSKQREILGTAEIKKKEPRSFSPLVLGQYTSTNEAKRDGFPGLITMVAWITKTHGIHRINQEPMNKLTLRWIRGGEAYKTLNI